MHGNTAIHAPALAGAPQTQTLSALLATAAGRIGTNPAMHHEARSLTPEQRIAVADYLRGLTKSSVALRTIPATPNGKTPPSVVELSMGAAIEEFGTSSGVKPCKACRGRVLQGNAAAGAPALAGMPRTKTLAALNAAASKKSKGDVIQNIARLLTPEQREDVAAFVVPMTPVKPRSGPAATPTTSSPSRTSVEAPLRAK
jgi:cytochrome c553